MHVLAVRFDLHFPQSHSLKERRAVLRPIIDGARHRFQVSIAEVGHQETWQRAEVGVAVVSGSVGVAESVVDEVERFVWSFPEVEVLSGVRTWLEEE